VVLKKKILSFIAMNNAG